MYKEDKKYWVLSGIFLFISILAVTIGVYALLGLWALVLYSAIGGYVGAKSFNMRLEDFKPTLNKYSGKADKTGA